MADQLKAGRWRRISLALVALALIMGIGVAIAIHVPAGPAELIVGKVESAPADPLGKYSTGRLLNVSLGAETAAVHAPAGACTIGGPILVRRQRMLLGYSLTAVACGLPQQPALLSSAAGRGTAPGAARGET